MGYVLTLNKKTGFDVSNVNVPIVIRDWRGILFYDTNALLPKVKSFNLPEGKYLVDSGYFKERAEPVKYKMIKMVHNGKRYKIPPSQFQIVFDNNVNKCSVYWNLGKIVFDHSFKEKPLNQLYFVLFHEYGHQYFSDESKCDLYAANYMKKKGFNPSQIAAAPVLSLSCQQIKRKQNVFDNLLKTR